MGRQSRRSGFTLIELLVVLTIILLISAVTLPALWHAFAHRQVSEAARVVQGSLVGARDEAIRTNSPAGIRLLPDPAFPIQYLANGQIDPALPLAANRIVPIAVAPDYTEGAVGIYPAQDYSAITNLPCLVVEESLGTWKQPDPAKPYIFFPNSPTSWWWNIRVGDKIRAGNAGRWYTIVGPMVVSPGPSTGNSELFTNVGASGTPSPWSRVLTSPDGQSITVRPEYLFLVNGRDDNGNGWIDEGYDGIDNNDNGVVDELAEWETEQW